jgi:hypothetical protein
MLRLYVRDPSKSVSLRLESSLIALPRRRDPRKSEARFDSGNPAKPSLYGVIFSPSAGFPTSF